MLSAYLHMDGEKLDKKGSELPKTPSLSSCSKDGTK
jgi:hypothetical protein